MTQHPLADALRTARNRLQRLALEMPFNSTVRADAFDWADKATKDLSQYEKSDTYTKQRIAELVAEGDGFWRPCSGCQESCDGYVSEKDYPYSDTFRCQPGSGCRECGGIGVIWDDTDYKDYARFALGEKSDTDRDQLREVAIAIIKAEARDLGYIEEDVADFDNPDGDDVLTVQAVERALASKTAIDPVTVERKRKPQDRGVWPPSMDQRQIEALIDEVCGCSGRHDCECSHVGSICGDAWGFHNSGEWWEEGVVARARRANRRRALGKDQ